MNTQQQDARPTTDQPIVVTEPVAITPSTDQRPLGTLTAPGAPAQASPVKPPGYSDTTSEPATARVPPKEPPPYS